MFLDLAVNGTHARALVDTGANTSFLSRDFASSADIDVRARQTRDVTLADGGTVPMDGVTAPVSLQCGPLRTQWPLQVLPALDGMDVVLGMDFLTAHAVDIRPRVRKLDLTLASGERVTLSAAPSRPRFCSDPGAPVAVISGASLARLLRVEADAQPELFLGFVRAVSSAAPPIDIAPVSHQPEDYVPLEAALRAEFADVVREGVPPGLPPVRKHADGRVLEHEIPLHDGAQPVSGRPYRFTPAEHEEVHKQVTHLTNQGWIRPSLSPWGSPILFQRKKNGKLRMCVDYRALNRETVKYAYPMPRIEQLLDKLRGYQVLSKLDLSDGFHQIRVAAADVHKTAFVTSQGAYEYLVMPFGLANAPAQFTLLMDTVPHDLPFVAVFMDDILVYSPSMHEHQSHVRAVLNRLREHKLFCSPKKCEFFRTSVEYLGHVVTPSGIAAVPSKLIEIDTWPIPTDIKTLRQFLGLTGFYRHFIKNFGAIAAPLTDLLQDNVSWHWSSRHASAFVALRAALSSAPVLAFPDPGQPFVLHTDASDFAVGCVLQQDLGKGLQPIAFLSKKLNDAERNYPVHEKELLAIVQALKTWRHHLQGAAFQSIVYTDHATLKHFLRQPKMSQRQMRWAQVFADFDLEIKRIGGNDNVVADALSRRPDLHEPRPRTLDPEISTPEPHEPKAPCPRTPDPGTSQPGLQASDPRAQDPGPSTHVPRTPGHPDVDNPRAANTDPVPRVLLASTQAPTDLFLERIRTAYRSDIDASELLLTTHPRRGQNANPAYRAFGGMLYFVDGGQYRLYVPNDRDLKLALLRDAHDAPIAGHPGTDRTFASLRRFYFWPNMLQEVIDYVRSCRSCQLVKPAPAPMAPQTTFPLPRHPFQEIALDWVGPLPSTARGNDFLLNVTDRLTKFAVAIPCRTTMTRLELADALFYNICLKFGFPQVIVSDRDRRIDNAFFRRLSDLQGTSHRLTTSYRPQGNGQAEGLNKELVNKLRVYCSDPTRASDWDRAVQVAAYAYNTSIHTAHHFTPFFLLHGFEPSSPYSLFWPSSRPKFPASGAAADVANFRAYHLECLRQAHANLQADADRRAARHAPPTSRLPRFRIGDLVRVSTAHLPRDPLDTKFAPRFLGPFSVRAQPSPFTFTIDFGAKFPGVNPNVNVDLLRAYIQPSTSRLRFTENDYPALGDIEDLTPCSLVARRPGRGKQPDHGRRNFQYRVRFQDRDACYDIWLSEAALHDRYAEAAPSLIREADARLAAAPA